MIDNVYSDTNPTLPKPCFDREWLDARFRYDPETGDLYWKHRTREDFKRDQDWKMFNTRDAGQIAGTTRKDRYRIVNISGTKYKVHRLIWNLYYDEIPDGMFIDHINGIKDDNRIENLRLATHSENYRNREANRNSVTGSKGVSFDKKSGKYAAQIQVNGKKIYLGHGNIEKCRKLYEEAANHFHGDFARIA